MDTVRYWEVVKSEGGEVWEGVGHRANALETRSCPDPSCRYCLCFLAAP